MALRDHRRPAKPTLWEYVVMPWLVGLNVCGLFLSKPGKLWQIGGGTWQGAAAVLGPLFIVSVLACYPLAIADRFREPYRLVIQLMGALLVTLAICVLIGVMMA